MEAMQARRRLEEGRRCRVSRRDSSLSSSKDGIDRLVRDGGDRADDIEKSAQWRRQTRDLMGCTNEVVLGECVEVRGTAVLQNHNPIQETDFAIYSLRDVETC